MRQFRTPLGRWGRRGSIAFLLALAISPCPTASPLEAEGLGSRENAQLTILHLADVYSIAPVDGGKSGGLARVAALEKALAKETNNLLVTLGGDFLSPSVASSIFQGEQMMASLAAAGLDIATLGNHEFDFGPEVLLRRMQEAKWDWVVSNVVDEATGEPIGGASPYLVREYGDLRVGFLGLCLAGEEISATKRQGISLLDPFAAAEKYLEILEAEGVDAVVALTHLDFADDVRLARLFPRIDLILGGHEHFPITTQVERTLITKPGSDARNVARVDISRPRPDDPIEKHFQMIPVSEAIEEDSEVAALVAEWESRLDRELDVVVGSTSEPLNAVAQDVRSGESNLGNLMADVMRRETGSEIAIVNGGSIRSNHVYPAGQLTRRDLVAIHPFGGIVCAVEVSGETVLAALNHGLGRLGESVGRFPQVSGIRLSVDPERVAGDRLDEVEVDGRPLDPNRLYTVAITDYMLEGGDGYSMFPNARVLVGPEEGSMIVTGLERLVSEQGTVAPRIEGRIRFKGEVAQAPAQRRVLLDTDMGIDSVMGLLYLLKAPQVSLEAITIVHGIADMKHGASNAVRILELTGDTGIPVAKGERRPLRGKRAFPSFWRPQANSLGGAKLPAMRGRPAKRGVDLILATLEASPEPVTIIAMGPLTNIATALGERPGIVDKIAEVAVMGGALEVRGNVGSPYVGIDNYAAEWNFYLDPHAAERVFRSGVPVRLMPLDATQVLPVTPEFVDRVRSRPLDQTSGLLLSLLTAVDEGIEAGWYYFWDVLAAVATARPDVLSCRDETVEVVTAEGPLLGQTRLNPDGARVCVVEDVNRQAFEDDLLRAILE
jgi:5'-nucleotidase